MATNDAVIRRATKADLPALGRLGALLMRTHYAFDQARFMAPGDNAEDGYAWFLGTQLEEAGFIEQPSELEFDTQLRVVTRLLSADGTVVFETEDTGTSEALTDNRWGYEHSTLVPIATLTPGAYVIQVVGETLYDVPASAARSIPITIVATPAENNH